MEDDRAHDLGSFIREQRNSARLSLRRLSDLAGISNPYLSQIERGLRKPSAEILQQIAKALRISAEALYIQAGILEERDGDTDVRAAIRRDEGISERQKQVLIEIYDTFRLEYDSQRPVPDVEQDDKKVIDDLRSAAAEMPAAKPAKPAKKAAKPRKAAAAVPDSPEATG